MNAAMVVSTLIGYGVSIGFFFAMLRMVRSFESDGRRVEPKPQGEKIAPAKAA